MPEHYLKGAKWVMKNDNFTYEGELNERGCADLKNIALGEYTFTLSKDGYETSKQIVRITTDPINIQADLTPLPPEENKPEKPVKKTTKKSAKKKSAEKEENNKKTTKKTTKKSGKKSEK